MIKKLHCVPFCFLLLLTWLHIAAQQGQWTWVSGDSIPDSNGSFGTQGVAAPSNVPPALYEVANWKDLDGNFWLLGGWQTPGIFATALWKYDLTNGYWTWINGPSAGSMAGVYGTQGIPSANNYPGSRCGGVPSWTDSSGNLWLYGGIGYDMIGALGDLSDTWMYNISTNEWTWMTGSPYTSVNPYYGTYQAYSSAVIPGPWGESTCAWKDNDGDFWMYGGYDVQGNSSTMWQFDPDIVQWSWMWGGASYFNTNYGTQGISSPNNSPGSRLVYTHWKDTQGRLWLSGGSGNSFGSYFSDEWMYDPAINEWTWMAGTSVPNQVSEHGPKCGTSGTYFPASRFENSSCWTDYEGNFWELGGCINSTSFDTYNDLWVFQPSTLTWIWNSGDTISQSTGLYGTQGIASPDNKPAARFGAASWIDCESNLWLFGGLRNDITGLTFLNDLWKYQIDPDCVPGFQSSTCNTSTASFSSTDISLCEKFCTDFFDESTNNPVAWLWQFPGGTPSSSTDQNPANICYQFPGTYDVTLITTDASGTSDTLTSGNYIIVFNTPPFPTITLNGYTLTSSAAATYQWQFNSVDITGATNQTWDAVQSGYYSVVISDSNGCVTSGTIYVLIEGIEELFPDQQVLIYPNPATGYFIVQFSTTNTTGVSNLAVIEIYNTLGQVIYRSDEFFPATNPKKEIKVENLSAGIYFIEIEAGNVFVKKKLIITAEH